MIPVSWASYWMTILLLGGLYYVVVLLICYRKELFSFFRSGTNAAPASSNARPAPAKQESALAEQPGTGFRESSPMVHEFLDELKILLTQQAVQGSEQPEVVFALSRLIDKYPALRMHPLQPEVHGSIVKTCFDQCGFILEVDDQDAIWQND